MPDENVETILQQVADGGPSSTTWLAYSRSGPSGVNSGWLAEASLRRINELKAEVAALNKKLEAAVAEAGIDPRIWVD